jgi:flagellar biosynthesis/type III secretory pathway protein FliH
VDSKIIRIPRVANASVPLAVNRQPRKKQHEKPLRDQAERKFNAEFTGILGEVPGKEDELSIPLLERATVGGLASDASEMGAANLYSALPKDTALDKPKEQEALQDEARRQAYQEGFASGVDDGRREFALQGQEIAALIESLGVLRGELLSELEDDVVSIVFQAVTTIIGNALVERVGVVEVVRQVIGQVRDRENLIVRVSSKDFELIKSACAQDGGAGQRVEVVAEPRILPGGCLVESSAGTLDGRLDVQLHSLRELLLGVRSGAGDA